MLDVTVVVATYGDVKWYDLAIERAIPSAEALGVPVVHAHRTTLHGARNAGLDQVRTEWVCHLDADDELTPGYFDAMAQGTADLRAPSVLYVRPIVSDPAAPIMPRVAGHEHDCTADCLSFGNWLVIGTVARAELLRSAGGWRDFDWSEDWDLWVRAWQAGATIEAIPDAVYVAYVRYNSRNRGRTRRAKLAAHRAIARANGLPVPA